MCLVLSSAVIVVRPLDLENQIFTRCDLDILVCVEEDPGELVSARRVLAVVIDLYLCTLEYDLSSLIKYDTELSTAEPSTSLA